MRFKIVLDVNHGVSGSTLPISYQLELSAAVNRLLTSDQVCYDNWLRQNNLDPELPLRMKVYSLSNLYIPNIVVTGNRLTIRAKRVQFWISFLPEQGTEDYVRNALMSQVFSIGDRISRVQFVVSDIQAVSPVTEFKETMDYISMSPVTVMAYDAENRIVYLSPDDQDFLPFLVDGILERYELYYGKPYEGDIRPAIHYLDAPRRKMISINSMTPKQYRVVCYMLRFRLTLPPELQHFAYVAGIGDKINYGFGYLELRDKTRE